MAVKRPSRKLKDLKSYRERRLSIGGAFSKRWTPRPYWGDALRSLRSTSFRIPMFRVQIMPSVGNVQMLLDAGIDVLTTMNIQHLESLNDQVCNITGIRVRETIPDWVMQQ